MFLGCCIWAAGIFAVVNSVYQVTARGMRPGVGLRVQIDGGGGAPDTGLRPGDNVFLDTDSGLSRIGEVEMIRQDGIHLKLEPQAFAQLAAGTRATCWRTPLSAEAAITGLLPSDVQEQMVAEITQSWRQHEQALLAAWKPIATDLTMEFLEVVGDELRAAVRLREPQLAQIGRSAVDSLVTRWPAFQARLNPILERHLTPVVSRLLNDAIDDAPKITIAYKLWRGHTAEAIEQVLDWLAEYLAELPEADRRELRAALLNTWEAARADPRLVELLADAGRELRDDPRLHRVLEEVYREAIADNPQTAQFIRERLVESPEIRRQIYAFVELFGPTARRLAALCLFDASGSTRPEVVHLVRSIALRRRIAWVTLQTPPVAEPGLQPGAAIAGVLGGGPS